MADKTKPEVETLSLEEAAKVEGGKKKVTKWKGKDGKTHVCVEDDYQIVCGTVKK